MLTGRQRGYPVDHTFGITAGGHERCLDGHHAHRSFPGGEVKANVIHGQGPGCERRLFVTFVQGQGQVTDRQLATGGNQFKLVTTGQLVAGFHGDGAIPQLPGQIGGQEVGQGVVANIGNTQPAFGIQRRYAQVALPVDVLVPDGGGDRVLAVRLFPLPGGQVVQGKIQRFDEEFGRFRLGEIPEQQLATFNGDLPEKQPGWFRRLRRLLNRLRFAGRRVGVLPVPGVVHRVVFQQIQADIRFGQADFLEADNAPHQLEETHIHPQLLEGRDRFVCLVTGGKAFDFHAQGKRINPDAFHLRLPAHTLFQLFGQGFFQPPGQQQEPRQCVQPHQYRQHDDTISRQMTFCLLLGHRPLPLKQH